MYVLLVISVFIQVQGLWYSAAVWTGQWATEEESVCLEGARFSLCQIFALFLFLGWICIWLPGLSVLLLHFCFFFLSLDSMFVFHLKIGACFNVVCADPVLASFQVTSGPSVLLNSSLSYELSHNILLDTLTSSFFFLDCWLFLIKCWFVLTSEKRG